MCTCVYPLFTIDCISACVGADLGVCPLQIGLVDAVLGACPLQIGLLGADLGACPLQIGRWLGVRVWEMNM